MLRSSKHLRWLGIDMQARWRRRTAVLVTYFTFIVVVFKVEDGGCWGHPILTILVLPAVVFILGVFSPIGPVKPFDLLPPERDSFNSRYIAVSGLDDLARYRYGVVNYDAATLEQQSNLLQTYRVGQRYYARTPDHDRQYGLDEQSWLDEREKSERVQAERWSRSWLIRIIIVYMWNFLVFRTTASPWLVSGTLLQLLILAMTLPQARILWTEPDPRDTPGEIQLTPTEV